MKLKRTKNTLRNALFNSLFKCVTIFGPFAVRTSMIYVMGVEYVGLSSLFTAILGVLSLAEMGVGEALVFSMYKPIAQDDAPAINALYALYRRLYRIIGTAVAAIGLLLVPVLPRLVRSDLPPDVNLYVLYGVYLFNTLVSYWLFGYKQSLLLAFQRSDVIGKRSIAILLLRYAAQIAVIHLTRDYYAFVVCLPLSTILTNIANKVIVDRMFPQYRCEGRVPPETERAIRRKVLALIGTKANTIVLNASDNIVISAFLGLALVGKYSNYYYVMHSVAAFLKILYSSMTAGLGNSLETESRDKNFRDFKTLTFLNAWIVMACSCCLLCLFQPFMRLWVKEKGLLPLPMVFLFVVYFYLYAIRRVVLTYKDAGGIWWEDRFRPYVVMAVNLGLNISLCQIIGLYGIILSTLVSMVVSLPWETFTVFHYIFHSSSLPYWRDWMAFAALTALLAAAAFALCSVLPIPASPFGLVLRLLLAFTLPNAIWFLLFRRHPALRIALRKLPMFAEVNETVQG